jgi:hypothetical protein
MMKKKILFMLSSMNIGGVEKALLSLLRKAGWVLRVYSGMGQSTGGRLV